MKQLGIISIPSTSSPPQFVSNIKQSEHPTLRNTEEMRMRSCIAYRLARIALWILLLCPCQVSSKRIRKDNDPMARRFRVRNFSPSPVEIYWINVATEERLLQFELSLGGSDTLNSHVAHEFEIREKTNKKGECKGRYLVVDLAARLETSCNSTV